MRNQTAEATAQLAKKLGETGAVNKLDQAREQVFYAETTADLGSARQEAASARERLARLLGLWGGDLDFRLPDRLPALPKRPASLPFIEADAVGHRIDLQIARMELDALGKIAAPDGGEPLRHHAADRRHRSQYERSGYPAVPRARF
jgi:outer membrane protein TolC